MHRLALPLHLALPLRLVSPPPCLTLLRLAGKAKPVVAILLALLTANLSIATGYATNNTLTTRATSPLTLVGSNWIWEKASYTLNTLLALRKDFEPPFGKSLIATEIIMTASTFTLYMNGEIFGQNSPHNACLNMFAATSSSVNTDDAIIGAIRVTYDDFTTDDLIGIRKF
ncbi:hypothetical protein B0H13DRAFT_2330777 [Mycena leptocephala]|nr:hypothetical protein B0H13DRAFT_2330777 [Mycena leptocephala]